MIEPASKYGKVKTERENVRLGQRENAPLSRSHGLPVSRSSPVTPSIFIPRLGKEVRFDEWYWKELREGGMLCNYIHRERYETSRRYRAVARRNHGQRQNNKSDQRRLADVPLRDYLRWRATDQHFWEDNNNLRSLRRDNPDAKVYL